MLKDNKLRETIKTVIITILITGIITFLAGVRYQTNQQNAIDSKVNKQVQTLKP